MTKNTKSSQGPTRACGLVVDLKRIVKNIEGLHSGAWSQQRKARHGATNQTVVEKANAARAAAAVRVEAPIEMADAATLKQDAEAAAAAPRRRPCAWRRRSRSPTLLRSSRMPRRRRRARGGGRRGGGRKGAKQRVAAKAAQAAQAKDGGDAAGPSSPAA